MENQTSSTPRQTDVTGSVTTPAVGSLVAGQCLIDARNAKGLSLEDVSKQTRIPQMHLRALERNEPDSMPARPFLTGYLRSCAAMLDLDAEQLLAAYGASSSEQSYAKTTAPDDESNSKPTVGVSWSAYPEAAQKTTLWRQGVMVMLPLFAISVLAWAYHVIDGKLSNAPVSAEEFAEASPPDSLGPLASTVVIAQADNNAIAGEVAYAAIEYSTSAEQSNIDEAAVADTQATAAPGSSTDTYAATNTERLPVASTNVAAIGSTAIVEETFVREKVLGETVLAEKMVAETTGPEAAAARIAMTLDNDPSLAVASAASAQPDAQSATRSPGAAAMVAQFQQRDRLVIWVREDSWIDVSDGLGNRLYRDLARAGKKIDVSGNLPFSLHLGNAPGLALELNGESFAITNYRDDNSARLTLGSR